MMKYELVLAMPLLVLWFLLAPALVLSQPVPTVSDMAPSPMPTQPPDCPKKCGDVDIPYPFGIGNRCAWSGRDEFAVTCDHSFNPPRPYQGDFEIKGISLLFGQMRVFAPVSQECFNSTSTTEPGKTARWQFNMFPSFLISQRSNEFTAIGCNTLAFLQGRNDWSYLSGCVTTCVSLDDAAPDGDPCTGLGCCQTPSIPGNLSTIKVKWGDYENPGWRWNPCSYAFVAEKGWYKFSRKDLNGTGGMVTDSQAAERGVPLVLDWAINGTCPPLPATPIASACVSVNSHCVNATQRLGYLCNCTRGYEGNPYVTGGCTNINECELRKSDPTTYEERYPCPSGSTCHDTDGSYYCKCNFGRRGKSCQPIAQLVVATVATICAIVVLVVLLWFIYRERKIRKQRGFFDKNGGKILESMNINIFTKEQLDKITTNYSTSIGNGAFGVVYEGITEDNQRVAVKRSSAKVEERSTDDFVNEITTQFRINHTNLVRLVGCCLETDVPMLVFELISNGSLCRVLHGDEKRSLSLQARLDIAIGSAEALSYMHSNGSQKIVHGDVKSGNILLGDNYMPKVSDFGSSKLTSVTKYANWSVMGDMNYIDPVYMKTGNFTEKSDVYSFGVVILELITRKKAKYDGSNSLPINFVKSYKEEGTRREMYDTEISFSAQPHYIECLDRIGGIAVQCLKEDVDERPTMAQVMDELKLAKLRVSEAEVMGN